MAENQFRDWVRPAICSDRNCVSSDPPKSSPGLARRAHPNLHWLPSEELHLSRARGILVGGWALGLLRWTDEVGG